MEKKSSLPSVENVSYISEILHRTAQFVSDTPWRSIHMSILCLNPDFSSLHFPPSLPTLPVYCTVTPNLYLPCNFTQAASDRFTTSPC